MSDEFRHAEADELPAVFDLRARAFNQGTANDWAASHERDPWRDAGADLVALSDDRVVATVRVLARRIAGVDSELGMAGFADVASDPAVRGQGYVRRLLALAHERNRSAGYDLAMLFTRSPWVYSGSAGFAALPTWWLEIDPRRTAVSDGGWIVEQVDPLRHLPALRQVYEQFGQGRPGYPLRGDAFWTHSARLTDGSWTRICRDRDGCVVAYLRVQRASDRRVTVQECPYVSAGAAFSLMAALGRDADFAECPTVGGRLPHDHVLGAAGEWSTRDNAMVRAYTRAGEQLLAHLRDPTNQRTVYWSGDSF
jgi:predicted N-acetyltransferase YhbS